MQQKEVRNKKAYSKYKKARAKIYASKRWQELRLLALQEHPTCIDCEKEGRLTPAAEVHHDKSPFEHGISYEEKMQRAWDFNNLVPLCKDCHVKRHMEMMETRIDKLIRKYTD